MRLVSTEWTDLDSGYRITAKSISGSGGVLRFAVIDDFGSCVTADGQLINEPIPSNRTEEFYNSCRFDDFNSAVYALKRFLDES